MEKVKKPTQVKKAPELLNENILFAVKGFESICTISIPKLMLPMKKINSSNFSFLLILKYFSI